MKPCLGVVVGCGAHVVRTGVVPCPYILGHKAIGTVIQPPRTFGGVPRYNTHARTDERDQTC